MLDGSADRDSDTTSAVAAFYNSIVGYEWTRLDHYVLEHATMLRLFAKYLPSAPARVIDIGGGPGRYAVHLATLGYDVRLLDLASANVEWAQEHFRQAGVVASAEIGDARDLSRFADDTFDVALLLGPLYHLSSLDDRQLAISEAMRVVRPGGVLISMMLGRSAAIYEGINRWPEGILDQDGVQRLLATGTGFNFERNPHDFEGVYFAHPSEVAPLHERTGCDTLALAACEGMLGGRRAQIEAMPEPMRSGWVRLVLETCEDTAYLGASERIAYVGRVR